MLDISHGNKLWAHLYYQRCRVPNTTLYMMDRPGPLRVRLNSGTNLNLNLNLNVDLDLNLIAIKIIPSLNYY